MIKKQKMYLLRLHLIFHYVAAFVLLNLLPVGISVFPTLAAEEPDASASANTRLIPLMVHLEQSLDFDATDGQSVQFSTGMYVVEPIIQGEPRLAFWNEQGTTLVQASRTEHHQAVKTAEVSLIQEDANKDTYHVVVFLPDGTALAATGSLNGIQTRGDIRATKHFQLDTATGVVRFGDGRQGRRLPSVSSNISTRYRDGAGRQGSELSMIELQSVVAQRQNSVALTTNLINSMQGHFQFEEGIDRPGDDYARHIEESPESCRTRCARDENCQAFTFVKPSPGSAQGQCFLKRSEPKPVANPCCMSGTRRSSQEKIIHNIGR